MTSALLVATATGTVGAADLQLEARLIRGANDAPATVKYAPADPGLEANLRRNFHWTNYYEITNLAAAIPLHESREIRMSDRCTLKIRNLGDSRVAVDCVGQGKQISRGTNTLPFVLGSNDTNNTAWFVSLKTAGSKAMPAFSRGSGE